VDHQSSDQFRAGHRSGRPLDIQMVYQGADDLGVCFGLPVLPLARIVAAPSAAIVPLSSYQSAAPLVPISPLQDPIFYFHGKVFDRRKSRAAIWVLVLVVIHRNAPVSIESRIAIAFSATNVIVKIAKKIVLRDEGFIRIGNYLTETARISPPIFYF
jgi:hypothetical protein